jgi:Yip1 domain
MFKVFFLIFDPGATWDKVAQKKRGLFFILTTYLVPMILLVTAAEGWSIFNYGKWQPRFSIFKHFTLPEIKAFEVTQAVALLALVFLAALLLHVAGNTFHGRRSYRQAFAVVAYGFSPLLLARLLDVAPQVSPWASWALGLGLMIWILYQGIPRVLEPDPTHTFGIYLTAIMVMVLTSGVARIFATMYLQGEVNNRHSWFIEWLAKYF